MGSDLRQRRQPRPERGQPARSGPSRTRPPPREGSTPTTRIRRAWTGQCERATRTSGTPSRPEVFASTCWTPVGGRQRGDGGPLQGRLRQPLDPELARVPMVGRRHGQPSGRGQAGRLPLPAPLGQLDRVQRHLSPEQLGQPQCRPPVWKRSSPPTACRSPSTGMLTPISGSSPASRGRSPTTSPAAVAASSNRSTAVARVSWPGLMSMPSAGAPVAAGPTSGSGSNCGVGSVTPTPPPAQVYNFLKVTVTGNTMS